MIVRDGAARLAGLDLPVEITVVFSKDYTTNACGKYVRRHVYCYVVRSKFFVGVQEKVILWKREKWARPNLK